MRVITLVLLISTLLLHPLAGRMEGQEKGKAMNVKKLTPVLLVEEVEPCVQFWAKLGFQKTVEVPEGNKLGFVILQKGDVELMYQSYASVEKDFSSNPLLTHKGPTFLYVEVENLEDTIAAVKGAEVVMPVRTTFYGSKEIGVKDPGGHMVTFAQMGVAPQK
ncbi:MAG: hypothetical protein LAO03_19815 [Acidobacteriia bacterium]|nr:hypothetical protein [Terriglobia bacterium]